MKRDFKKPNVVISRCIEHGMCRYDGSQISSMFVKRMAPYVEFIPICPEVSIGLETPRESVRIIQGDQGEQLVYSRTGTDVTDEMTKFSKNYVKTLKDQNIHGFILKSRSPSCGIKDVKIYKTFGKTPAIGKTEGFFGGEINRNFKGCAIEDEGRLMNFNIREHFLTQLFTLSEFDKVREANTMKSLINFHSINKYLLMAYHQKNQKILGKIVANHEKNKVERVISDYELILKESLDCSLLRGRNINMLMHLFGYFKKDINTAEKAYFLEILEQYSTKKVPFKVPMSILYSWVIRFDEPYLKYQTIFMPFPEGILEVSDSGKGID